ncbi:hypothetical protein PPGU19_084940 (plasmid) [Paraburkholderia sp. PGU19]|nr:hypothetical protein PPGU19_084940 [Paraburkholderia sp. PGU19]
MRDPCHSAKQHKAHYEGKPDADPLGLGPLSRWQLVAENGNEDEVVDPEHNLHDHKCHKSSPDGGITSESDEEVRTHGITPG